jgi:transposase-like protein
MKRFNPSDTTAGGAESITAPSHCPGCRSRDVITTSKVFTDETYWRCRACGEVWNVGRRRAASYRDNTARVWER